MFETCAARNWPRHFIVALGGSFYAGSMLLLIYQYIGINVGWPGIFLSALRDERGDLWLDIDWTHPVLGGFFLALVLIAGVYATIRRHDGRSYREPEARSQPGF